VPQTLMKPHFFDKRRQKDRVSPSPFFQKNINKERERGVYLSVFIPQAQAGCGFQAQTALSFFVCECLR